MNWALIYRYFLAAILAIKIRLAVLFLLILALLALYLVLEKPSYKTSWTMLLPGTERSSTINLDNLGEARSNGGNAYGSVSISPKNTYKEIALSDAVINKAAAEYGVEVYAFSKPRITLIDQTPAMKFTLKGESQEELIYRANLYNDTFHSTLDELRKNEIERHYQGIEKNLADAKERLTQARQDIVEYQTNSNFISESQLEGWVSNAEKLRTDKTQTEVSTAQLGATINASLSQLGITSAQAEALLILLSNPAINATLKQLSEQLAKQSSYKALYAEENPLRKRVDIQVKQLTKDIRKKFSNVPGIKTIPNIKLYGLLSDSSVENIREINASLAKYNGLNAQKAALESNQQTYQARIKSHTSNAAALADLQRDHQIAEAIFSSALARLDTSRLDIYATYPLTQLLTQPGATVKRDRLQTKLMIIAAFLIYGMLALAMVLSKLRETLSRQNLNDKNQNTLASQQEESKLDHNIPLTNTNITIRKL